MKHRLAIADSVAKQLTDEMNVPKAQIASMETTSRKIIDDSRSEFALKEEHLQRKMESDVSSQSHTIGILKAKVYNSANKRIGRSTSPTYRG